MKAEPELLRAALAAYEYQFYCSYTHFGAYKHAEHTRYLCWALEQVERGEIDRCMVFMPPRHSKSMTVTETFPSWYIGRKPSRRVIVACYGDSLARRFGRTNRRKVERFGKDTFGVELQHGSATMTNWNIASHGGGLLSVGIGGPIVGEGADLLVIDDPIKNRQEADSKTYREQLWDEWRNTLLSRLAPGGAVILIQTRWHEDDLAGRLLRMEGDRWTVLKLPALAEENDPLGRPIGAPLWPEYGFDAQWAEHRQQEVGSYVWNALYQQRPAPAEGGIFKRGWWRHYQSPPQEFDEVFQSWDMAFKETRESSYVVGQVWGRKGADLYLLDQVRDRMDFVDTLRAVTSLSERWPEARAKLVEDKANGPAVISALKRTVGGLVPRTPSGSKQSRAVVTSPLVESGNVHLPAKAPWLDVYMTELCSFPGSQTDDQVDATTQALYHVTSRRVGGLMR